VQAIGAAREAVYAVYIENQAIPMRRIAAALAQVLERAVDVVLLVPATQRRMSAGRVETLNAGPYSIRWQRSTDMIISRSLASPQKSTWRTTRHLRPRQDHADRRLLGDNWFV
jgi:hypothetical protein